MVWFLDEVMGMLALMICIFSIHFVVSGCMQMVAIMSFDFLLALGGVVLVEFLISLTVNYFAEGHRGVKPLLLREGWLKTVDRWLNGVSKPLISVRWASISGERWEQVQGMSRSTFLKRVTFIVLFLNRCCSLKWIDVSLARDAYNAYSRRAGRRQ
ncbi:MAG: hypothetical protein QM501_02695, partial [Gimesia sp.]